MAEQNIHREAQDIAYNKPETQSDAFPVWPRRLGPLAISASDLAPSSIGIGPMIDQIDADLKGFESSVVMATRPRIRTDSKGRQYEDTPGGRVYIAPIPERGNPGGVVRKPRKMTPPNSK